MLLHYSIRNKADMHHQFDISIGREASIYLTEERSAEVPSTCAQPPQVMLTGVSRKEYRRGLEAYSTHFLRVVSIF